MLLIMVSLWESADHSAWQAALDGYEAAVATKLQGDQRLIELDRWARSGRVSGAAGPVRHEIAS